MDMKKPPRGLWGHTRSGSIQMIGFINYDKNFCPPPPPPPPVVVEPEPVVIVEPVKP